MAFVALTPTNYTVLFVTGTITFWAVHEEIYVISIYIYFCLPMPTNEPITISEAIKAIRSHTSEMSETENYVISGDRIQKVGDDGYLGEIVYQVKEEN